MLFVRLFDLRLFGFVFPLPLGVWVGLRFVIVSLPGLFSYLFFSNLSAFRTFVRFALVWFCLFPLLLGVWVGLRFVIVALPGLFSYLCFQRLQIILQFKYSHSPF